MSKFAQIVNQPCPSGPRAPQRVTVAAWRKLRQLRPGDSAPMLLRDELRHWPAYRSWTFERLRGEFGETKVPVRPGTTLDGAHRVETLGEFVRKIPNGADHCGYVGNIDIRRYLPVLQRDVRFRRLSRSLFARADLWLGPAGTVAPLHCDFAHNLFAQFVGSKRFQLFPPSATADLRPHLTTWYSSFSRLEVEPQEEQSGQPPVPAYDFVVRRGDLLFLPFGWWHRVISLEPSISANQWWWTLGMATRRLPVALHEAMRSHLRRAGRVVN